MKNPRFASATFLLTALAALTSGVASAQTAPPPGAPPPAPPPGAVYNPGAPPPGAYPPGAYPPGYAPPPPEDPNATRFRWGISGFGGKYFAAGSSGGAGGIDARFGAQFGSQYGVYGSPVLLAGAGASYSSNGTTATASAVALYGISAMFDYTLDDLLFLAAGPEILAGGGGAAAVKSDSSSATAEAGTYLGVRARAGIALGSIKPARRKCFTLAIDLHTVFMTKTFVAPMLSIGFDSF